MLFPCKLCLFGHTWIFYVTHCARTDESFYHLHIFLSPKSNSPELVYELELAALSEAESKGKASKAQAHREEASAARSVLPHFNLEGLWVGK